MTIKEDRETFAQKLAAEAKASAEQIPVCTCRWMDWGAGRRRRGWIIGEEAHSTHPPTHPPRPGQGSRLGGGAEEGLAGPQCQVHLCLRPLHERVEPA